MKITTISNKIYVTEDFYLEQPMRMIEWNLYTKNAKYRHLINALDRKKMTL